VKRKKKDEQQFSKGSHNGSRLLTGWFLDRAKYPEQGFVMYEVALPEDLVAKYVTKLNEAELIGIQSDRIRFAVAQFPANNSSAPGQ